MTAQKPATTQPDGSLPEARKNLADAISALIDPRPHLTDQGLQWLDSRYHDLREALTSQRLGASHAAGPKEPAWLAAIHLLKIIDRRAQALEPCWPINDCDEYPTIQRLRQLDTRKWRPQDTALVTRITGDLSKDAAEIDKLFAPHESSTSPTPAQTASKPKPAAPTKKAEKTASPPSINHPRRRPSQAHCNHCRYSLAPKTT
jgi:hypothetical protein